MCCNTNAILMLILTARCLLEPRYSLTGTDLCYMLAGSPLQYITARFTACFGALGMFFTVQEWGREEAVHGDASGEHKGVTL